VQSSIVENIQDVEKRVYLFAAVHYMINICQEAIYRHFRYPLYFAVEIFMVTS